MSDKTRFYRMTKPVRFRKLKQIFRTVRFTYGVGKEIISYLIKYRFNYILYKLNIYKRYTYRDKSEKVLLSPPYTTFPMRSVQTKYFRGLVSMRLVEVTDIDTDYFYRERKDGSRKITMYVKNVENKSIYAESHLINISINVGGKWFNTNNNLPTFVMHEAERLKPFIPYDRIERPTEPKTVAYDVSKLRKLTYVSFLGLNITKDDISESMQKYYYGLAYENLHKELDSISLKDLMQW